MNNKEGNIEKKKRNNGDTLLTYECKNGNIEKVKNLIESGENINEPNKDGDTPLLISIKKSNKELTELLLSYNDIDINKKSNYGISPLLEACYLNNKDIVNMLINYGANVNISDNINNLPLHIACYFNNIEIINSLININNKLYEESNLFGDTPKKISEQLNNKEWNDGLNDKNIDSKRLNESFSTNNQEMELPKKKMIQFKKLFKEINRSICLINVDNSYCTGFFIEIPIPSKRNPLHGLMTFNCVLNEKRLKSDKSFTIVMACKEDEKIEIKMKNQGFVFISDLIEITFIELSHEIIEKYKPSFLRPSKKNASNNESILIFQYPNLEYSFAHGTIQSSHGFNYYHDVMTSNGSSGSPLLNENLEVVGVHKSRSTYLSRLGNEKENMDVKIAVKISEIIYAIKVLYNNRNLEGLKRAKKSPKKLSEIQLKELSDHGIELKLKSKEIETLNNESGYNNKQLKMLGQTLFYCTFSQKELLFYRTNYAWYVTILPEKNIIQNYNLNYFKRLNWTPLISNSEKLDQNIMSQINGREYALITWLKLTELMYL